MKKLIIGAALVAVVAIAHDARAQTVSPTPDKTPTIAPTNVVTKEVQNLKDKLATKVVQLRKANHKAVSGVVDAVNAKTITIKDAAGKSVQVKVDEVLTKSFRISGTTKKEIKNTDVTKGDYIIITGPVADDTVTANTIYIDEQYIVGSGKITEVNAADFTLSVVSEDKENLTIDVENNTRRLLVDSKTLAKEVIGFTKIKVGDSIHYVLRKTGEEKVKDRYGALRIVIIPQEYFVAQ